tara:strand:- start:55 stop:243 length:189 start_codon:yes stop_codon:yes gene_type:complete
MPVTGKVICLIAVISSSQYFPDPERVLKQVPTQPNGLAAALKSRISLRALCASELKDVYYLA